MHIKRLPLDTLITGIGRLFKYDDKPWFINLWGRYRKSKAKYYTSLFHACICWPNVELSIPPQNEHRKSGFHLKFRCPLPAEWMSFAQSNHNFTFLGLMLWQRFQMKLKPLSKSIFNCHSLN